jgi:hypothetical protein
VFEVLDVCAFVAAKMLSKCCDDCKPSVRETFIENLDRADRVINPSCVN